MRASCGPSLSPKMSRWSSLIVDPHSCHQPTSSSLLLSRCFLVHHQDNARHAVVFLMADADIQRTNPISRGIQHRWLPLPPHDFDIQKAWVLSKRLKERLFDGKNAGKMFVLVTCKF